MYNDYISKRRLKPKTVLGYDSVLKNQLGDLRHKQLGEIDRESISKLHRDEKARGQADLSMRLLRSLFNFAKNEYLDDESKSLFPYNPMAILSHRRQWNNLPRKNGHLRKNEIPKFLEAIANVKSSETYTGISICNALKFALLTGLRRNEIFSLMWQDINFKGSFLVIQNTKNAIPLELPITKYLDGILQEQFRRAISDFVFGADNETGQVLEPKKSWQK